MDNGQLIIDNDCVAYGDYLNHFPEENTLIIHYTLSIIHYQFVYRYDKPEFILLFWEKFFLTK